MFVCLLLRVNLVLVPYISANRLYKVNIFLGLKITLIDFVYIFLLLHENENIEQKVSQVFHETGLLHISFSL